MNQTLNFTQAYACCHSSGCCHSNFELLIFSGTCLALTALRKSSLFVIIQASLVECYSNHTTTRIRIQTAGLAFGGTGLCSCHVRGVDGSCAKHLTVESYMVIYAPNSYTDQLLLLVFHHPLSFIPDLEPFSANPSHCSLSFSFFRTNYMIPQTCTVTSNISAFTFQFFAFTIFSCRLRAVD